MSRYTREENSQTERGRKRLRKKWAQGKASDSYHYFVHRVAPRVGGMFATAINNAIMADLERTAEAMFADPQWWRSGNEPPTMVDGRAFFHAEREPGYHRTASSTSNGL